MAETQEQKQIIPSNVKRIFDEIFKLKKAIESFEKEKNIKLTFNFVIPNFNFRESEKLKEFLNHAFSFKNEPWDDYTKLYKLENNIASPNTYLCEIWDFDLIPTSETYGQMYLKNLKLLKNEQKAFSYNLEEIEKNPKTFAQLNKIKVDVVQEYVSLIRELQNRFYILWSNKLWDFPKHLNLEYTYETLFRSINKEEKMQEFFASSFYNQLLLSQEEENDDFDDQDYDQEVEDIDFSKDITEESTTANKETTEPEPQTFNQKNQIFDFKNENKINNFFNMHYKEHIKELNLFFNQKKQLLPNIKAKLSHFDLYVIQTLLECISSKDKLNHNYKLTLKLQKDRAPAVLSSIWSLNAKIYGVLKPEDENAILFQNLSSAEESSEYISKILEHPNSKLKCAKTNTFDLTEQPFVPYSLINIFDSLIFDFSSSEEFLQSAEAFTNMLEGSSPVIKIVKFNDISKDDWIKIFETIKKIIPTVLSSKELKTFKFLSSTAIYDKFSSIQNDSLLKNLLIPVDFELTPNKFKTDKNNSIFAYRIYQILYFAWIKAIINSPKQKQILELYNINTISFYCDTKIFSKTSAFLFKPELFVNYIPYVRIFKSKVNELIKPLTTKLEIKESPKHSLSLIQFNFLFQNPNFAWANYKFVLKSIFNLVNQGIIKIHKRTITLTSNLVDYYDSFKSKKFKTLTTNIKSAFNDYFKIIDKLKSVSDLSNANNEELSSLTSQFLQNIKKINKKPN